MARIIIRVIDEVESVVLSTIAAVVFVIMVLVGGNCIYDKVQYDKNITMDSVQETTLEVVDLMMEVVDGVMGE